MNHRLEQVEELISEEKADLAECLKGASWDTFYEMSVMREGILNWYHFKDDARVLLISDGYGGIVELLCRNAREVTVVEKEAVRAETICKRCERFKNLSVETEDPIDHIQKYDYVILEKSVQTKSELRDWISRCLPSLNRTGIMLFTCTNRLGMRYWCGVPDTLTGVPFAGIRQNDGKERLTRADIVNILEKEKGIRRWKLYYPAPDEKIPQAIYTDRYLPKKSIRDRVIPYYTEKDTLIALEDEISDTLITNGIYPVFANSFLIECSPSEHISDVIFAALSTDRGKKHGFATVITENGKVCKKMLHQAGRNSLELLCKNEKELSERGICCIKHKLTEEGVEMPFVEALTLVEHIKQTFDNFPEKVEGLFELLYEKILNSSEWVAFEKCDLYQGNIREEDGGIILKKAYIDMIPYNCFYLDGELVFYDQEFVRENFPAKYVLFRALRYTYIYIPELETQISLQSFKEKYRLESVWEIFEREESRFVEENRNYDTMSAFYQWAGVTKTEVDQNVNRLQGITEISRSVSQEHSYGFNKKTYTIDLYKKDYKLNEIKRVQIAMLKEFIRICQEYSLSYCAIYGTLLGAIRHKGYIPWDDDLDIAMPRVDYDRFLEVAPSILAEEYFLQTPESDEGCFYGGYCKLRDSRTTAFEKRNEGNECNQGIWIDIFPLDEVLKDEKERELQKKRIQHYQRLLYKKSYPFKRVLWDISEEEEKYCQKTADLFERQELCNALHDALAGFGSRVNGKLAVMSRYMGSEDPLEYDAAEFEFLIPAVFEDMEINIPSGYENILKNEYGDDYLLYPAPEERKPHHEAVYDTRNTYIDYCL